MIKRLSLFAMLVALAIATPHTPSRADALRGDVEAIVKDYLAAHPEDVERIVRNYLTKNPDVLRDALVEMIKNRGGSPSAARPATPSLPDRTAEIRGNAQDLFNSPHQVVVGNPQGKTTLVEFFDYNCGYCKRALGDLESLIKDDPDLRVVLKEFPVLGVGSVEAARVAIAVRMEDPGGRKYLEFHHRLLGGAQRADKATAMATAVDLGLDAARLEKDMASDEVSKTLEESGRLAQALGINGTPGYVVGTTMIPGAIGAARLKETIARVRAEAQKPRG